MSAPAFTPGPWTAHPHDGRAFYIHAPHMLAPRIATVAYSDGAHSFHEANAHLIAAAPELYGALLALLGVVDGQPAPPDEQAERIENAVFNGFAAIRKAQGSPHDQQT